jgi:hypothetical protein
MDTTKWILLGSVVVAGVAALLALGQIVEWVRWGLGSLYKKVRLPDPPERIRSTVSRLRGILGKSTVRLLLCIGFAIGIGYLVATPWTAKSRWTNREALDTPNVPQPFSGPKPSPLISALARQINSDGTLVAIAISGGGSRAAYFAANVLQRLSLVKWPGQNAGSLVEHVNIISSVSGGSLAAAYFVLNGPVRGDAGPQELAPFFERFKRAMATNIEGAALTELLDPRQTLAMLTLQRPMAEAVANAIDKVLDGGRDTAMATLQDRAAAGKGPILLLNATMLDTTEPFVFVSDTNQRPIFTLARSPEDNGLPNFSRSVDSSPRYIKSFTDEYGDLSHYRIADAVAASAAFPVALGSISLGTRYGHTVRLGDGGLVDNLGLLSLYSILLDPDFYRLTRGRLRRIVVISIDSENQTIDTGLLAGVDGLSVWSEEALHRFVIPAMIKSAKRRELGDELDDQAWNGLGDLFPPSPIYISFSECNNGATVGTRFRISETDRRTVDAASEVCVYDAAVKRLETILSTPPKVPERRYDGKMTSVDVAASKALIEIALYEQYWWRWERKTVPIETLTTERPLWAPWPTQNGDQWAPQRIDPLDPKSIPTDQFDYSATSGPDGGVILRATPRLYGHPGRVSFYLSLSPELLNDRDLCIDAQESVRALDNEGKGPAGPSAPLFAIYSISPLRC